jgi:hypothetical protein
MLPEKSVISLQREVCLGCSALGTYTLFSALAEETASSDTWMIEIRYLYSTPSYPLETIIIAYAYNDYQYPFLAVQTLLRLRHQGGNLYPRQIMRGGLLFVGSEQFPADLNWI